MKSNSTIFSIFAILFAAFFAGAFLNGERLRTREARRELDSIRQEQTRILERLQDVQQHIRREDSLVSAHVDSANVLLQELLQERMDRQDVRAAVEEEVARRRGQLKSDIKKTDPLAN